LTQYLNVKTIRTHVECQDWEEAVREAGNILLENGGVESSYIDGMVKYIKMYGPYMVLMPGFALAHARPEDGAKQVAMSMITLKNPVKFGHEDYDPVYVVMGLSAPAAERHLEALADICNILKEEKILELIRGARDASDIMKVFEK
jgi:Phosphotransferase system mannitol/fructose-specific IIA domain (Ntr-type)